MAYVKDVGFGDGDEGIRSDKLSKYEAKKDHTDRIAIVMRKLDADNKPIMDKINFKVSDTHYHPAIGTIQCFKGACCERLGAPKSRIVTAIVKYPTFRNGDIDKDHFKNFEVLPWVINADKYDTLKRRNKVNPLHTNDLEITCKVEKFQNLDIQPLGEAIWLKNEKMKEDVLKKMLEMSPKLDNMLGKVMDVATFKEAMNENVTDAVEGAAEASADYSSILNDI